MKGRKGSVMTDFNEMLKLDPLAEAEKLTGKSYKDDEATSALGMLMHMEHNDRKREALNARDDTYYSISFDKTLQVFDDLGFVRVHDHTIVESNYDDIFVVLWHPDGVLATTESYRNGESTNTAKIHYNWQIDDPSRGDLWDFISSGSWVSDSVLSGDHDVREGLRHIMNKFWANGAFLNPWIDRPFLWLLDYGQPKVVGYDYKAITNDLIAELPEPVRAMIGE